MSARKRIARGSGDRIAIRHNGSIANPRTIDAASVLNQLIDNASTPHSGHHEIALTLVNAEVNESNDEDWQDTDDKVGRRQKKGRKEVVGCLAELLQEKKVGHF